MGTPTAPTAPDSRQTVLPGFEEFFKPPATLSYNARRVAQIIQGYARGAWGFCGAKQATLARVLGRSVRWLASALAELRAFGLLDVKLRGPHAAEYRLKTKELAELLQSFQPASSITECKESRTARPPQTPTRKPPKRVEPDWDAMDRERIADWIRVGIPRSLWPVHLREAVA